MNRPHPNDPLHGVTLESILTTMVEEHGWEWLGERIVVRCFLFEPSLKSSLKFLRKTPWARTRLEELYLQTLPEPPAAFEPPTTGAPEGIV